MSKRSIRRSDAQKQMLVWNGWSDMLDIGEDRLSGILGKREKCRPDRLAGYANCPLIPIDIIELHRHDVAGTQPKPSQQQDQCSVANTDGCRRRSEEHTSELQSLMRISYAVFCLQTKKDNKKNPTT